MHRFFCPDITTQFQLPESESRHCTRVLRLGVGDEIEVVDGKGGIHTCRISVANSRLCSVEIIQSRIEHPHWGHDITLAIAPTKNADRIEWLAEKVTELGINRIIPIRCRHSERKELKIDRIAKIMVSAMKQSLKAYLPHLDQMTPIADAITSATGQKFIAYCGPEAASNDLSQLYTPCQDVTIMIGPEGDFSEEEVSAAIASGFTPVTLGKSRLRTETAALYAVAAIHALDQQQTKPLPQ